MKSVELRELDARIAEKVMGWDWFCDSGNSYLFPPIAFTYLEDFHVHWTRGLHPEGWTRTEPRKKQSKKSFQPVSVYGDDHKIETPRYTTDSAASDALDVKILEKCGIFTLSRGKTNGAWIFGIGK